MVRPIVRDPVFLGRKSENAGPEDLPIGNDLLDTLNAHTAECVGMAANMIGKAKRIIVFSSEHGAELMFNPEIIRKEDSYETEEGCLSLPGTRRTVRYRKIKVRYQNDCFEVRFKTYTGWTAQIIQHEVDHCNGILI